MAEIIHFVPRAELEAAANLKGFIDVCRNQLTVFVDELCAIFDDPSIPPGTVIQAAKAPGASRLEQAAGDRARGTADLRVPGAMLPAPPPRGLRAPGSVAKKGVRA